MSSQTATPPIRFEFRKGTFLSRVQLHLIYWGTHWRDAKHPSVADVSSAVKKIICPGRYLSGLAQYNRLGCEPVVDFVQTPYDVDAENPPKTFQDDATHSDVVEEVKSLMGPIERESPPDPHAQPLYLVMMPPGTTCSSTDTDGELLAGEHNWFVKDGHRRVYYGWVLHGTIERMTIALSEELAESITDPEPPCCDDALAGWVMKDNQGEFQEVCDVCEGITATVDGVRVQTYFSNEKMDCIAPPAIPK
ncbi:MAG: hypothetical protein ABSH32_13695 [Bryobacteraceae bacterium]|jgi:hypothetical protein